LLQHLAKNSMPAALTAEGAAGGGAEARPVNAPISSSRSRNRSYINIPPSNGTLRAYCAASAQEVCREQKDRHRYSLAPTRPCLFHSRRRMRYA
jgi:hypothetical protein